MPSTTSNPTENTVLGLFFAEDAVDVKLGDSILRQVGNEKWCLVKGGLRMRRGVPVEGA